MKCQKPESNGLKTRDFNMISVLERIDNKLIKYREHELWETYFNNVQDPSVALANLKAYAPAISYFVMAFRDLNEYVLTYENPKNSLEIAINEHAKEDSTHYKLFMEDWEKLGGDSLLSAYNHMIPTLPLENHQADITETFATMGPEKNLSCSMKILSFLWSDETNGHNRKLISKCTQLVYSCATDPIVRFAIIEAIEGTGLFAFTATSELLKIANKVTNLELRYFGDYHLALETGHIVNQEQLMKVKSAGTECDCETDEIFKRLPLTETQYKQCIKAVDCLTGYFTEWLDHVYNMMNQYK